MGGCQPPFRPASAGADLEEEQGGLGALETVDLLPNSQKMCMHQAGMSMP
jgi:hypothetical protein